MEALGRVKTKEPQARRKKNDAKGDGDSNEGENRGKEDARRRGFPHSPTEKRKKET